MSQPLKETAWFVRERVKYQGSIPRQLQNATQLTRFGKLNTDDMRDKRFGRLKIDAKAAAKRNMPKELEGKLPFPNRARGAWYSPVGFNSARKQSVVREQIEAVAE
jgi:hypothetical protein